MTEAIQAGDTISVHYTGKLENGEVFDSSEGQSPFKFTVGSGQLILGFDKAVIGLRSGDNKKVSIPPEEAYGLHDEKYVVNIPNHAIPKELKVELGQKVELQNQNGQMVPATVIELKEEEVMVDINHSLAGKTLEFDISIVETGLEPDPQGHTCGCGHEHGDGHQHESGHECGCKDDKDHGHDHGDTCGCGHHH